MRHRLYGGVRGRCCNAPLYSIGLLAKVRGLQINDIEKYIRGNNTDQK